MKIQVHMRTGLSPAQNPFLRKVIFMIIKNRYIIALIISPDR